LLIGHSSRYGLLSSRATLSGFGGFLPGSTVFAGGSSFLSRCTMLTRGGGFPSRSAVFASNISLLSSGASFASRGGFFPSGTAFWIHLLPPSLLVLWLELQPKVLQDARTNAGRSGWSCGRSVRHSNGNGRIDFRRTLTYSFNLKTSGRTALCDISRDGASRLYLRHAGPDPTDVALRTSSVFWIRHPLIIIAKPMLLK
jgi:hypothetical protein